MNPKFSNDIHFQELARQVGRDASWAEYCKAYISGLRQVLEMLDKNIETVGWRESHPLGHININLLLDSAHAIKKAVKIMEDKCMNRLDHGYHAKGAIFASNLAKRIEVLDLNTSTVRSRYHRAFKKRFEYSDDLQCGGLNLFNRWLTGWIPNDNELSALCDALECTPRDLCPWMKPTESNPSNE